MPSQRPRMVPTAATRRGLRRSCMMRFRVLVFRLPGERAGLDAAQGAPPWPVTSSPRVSLSRFGRLPHRRSPPPPASHARLFPLLEGPGFLQLSHSSSPPVGRWLGTDRQLERERENLLSLSLSPRATDRQKTPVCLSLALVRGETDSDQGETGKGEKGGVRPRWPRPCAPVRPRSPRAFAGKP